MLRMDPADVCSFFACDADGHLTWKVRTGRRAKVGDAAGCLRPDGYLAVRCLGWLYLAHHLVWAITYRVWPTGDIDHIDGVRHNNSPQNLRDVTHSVNMQNRKGANSNSATGVLGVQHARPNGRGPVAVLKVNGKSRHLGTFDTIEAASAARLAASRRLMPGFTL